MERYRKKAVPLGIAFFIMSAWEIVESGFIACANGSHGYVTYGTHFAFSAKIE